MERKRNQKGFTLAELLIVVAIIAVLVAIAIPVFTRQLERSRESTDLSNVRSAYAELVTAYLTDGKPQNATVQAKQTVDNWQSGPTGNDYSVFIGTSITTNSTSDGQIGVPFQVAPNNYTVAIDSSGIVTVSGKN